MSKPELETIERNTMHILETYDEARNDDNYLVVTYWRVIDKWDGDCGTYTMRHLTDCESVRRVRQKIQNEKNLFQPTDPEVFRKRQSMEKKYRRYALENDKPRIWEDIFP